MTGWTAIIPVKRFQKAKQRLDVPTSLRHSLAQAFAQDVVVVALETPGIARVVVVSSEPAIRLFARRHGAYVVSDPVFSGVDRLNASIRRGACWAERQVSSDHVVVLPADLPSIDVFSLRDALTSASDLCRAFVSDAGGTGTSLLMASTPRLLDPKYGAGSATLHRQSGYVELTSVSPRLRRDVDDLDALRLAVSLGVGEFTFSTLHDSATTGPAPHDVLVLRHGPDG